MKGTIKASVLGVSILILTACSMVTGNGELATKIVKAEPYRELSIGGDFDARINGTELEKHTISITSDSNVLPYIYHHQSGTRYTVSTDDTVSPTEAVIEVQEPDLAYVALRGDNNAELNLDKVQHFTLVIAGDALAQLNTVDVDRLSFDISGDGEVTAEGQTELLEVDIAGNGVVDLSNLVVTTARVNIAGSGTVLFGQVENLDVSISGDGEVHYKGRARVHSSISGSGQINSLDLN